MKFAILKLSVCLLIISCDNTTPKQSTQIEIPTKENTVQTTLKDTIETIKQDIPQETPQVVNSSEIVAKTKKSEPTKSLGSWKNEYGLYTMYSYKDGRIVLFSMFYDGSKMEENIEAKKRKGITIYNVKGDDYEYFVIKKDGLYIYDRYGDLGLIYKNN